MASPDSSSSLPTVPPTAPQPTDPLELTSWALAKAQLIRPHKVLKFQEPPRPHRLLQLNTRSRQGRSSIPKLDLTRTQNIDAVLIFIFGIKRETPCHHCAKGNGIFLGCYTESSIASGACANCAYSSRGITCSFHRHTKSKPLKSKKLEDIISTITPIQWRALGEELLQRAAAKDKNHA
ncbi:hypothetical protein EDB81DRAFT_298725 [Dactylonectria macrodidyma]|uniref:Uncharacterized protein n=1 Tax=Dactylonectria macrodidyma TaxID=307937 RepID=A0A9P9I7J3_9HYPO|nr:hypothetical protein EDB81DRAFT_420109 [Dactylonectria macrodidyma]KAH7114632.1 hypothetical protein EDB81DRAFT_298725 [Dactylonectria macrodidyma]